MEDLGPIVLDRTPYQEPRSAGALLVRGLIIMGIAAAPIILPLLGSNSRGTAEASSQNMGLAFLIVGLVMVLGPFMAIGFVFGLGTFIVGLVRAIASPFSRRNP